MMAKSIQSFRIKEDRLRFVSSRLIVVSRQTANIDTVYWHNKLQIMQIQIVSRAEGSSTKVCFFSLFLFVLQKIKWLVLLYKNDKNLFVNIIDFLQLCYEKPVVAMWEIR